MLCRDLANRLANPFPLRLTWFTNPSGARVPRVSGTLRGERIRRNFKTEADAQAFINQHVPAVAPPLIKPVLTHLAPELVRELEGCLPDLPAGTTLRQALAFFRENYRPTAALAIADSTDADGKPVPGASTRWADWLKSTRQAKPAVADQWAGLVRRFAREVGAVTTFDVTSSRLRAWIYDDARFEVRTQRDYFDWLNYFCRWILREKMLAIDPFAGLDRPVVKNRPPPNIFTTEQVTALLSAALTDPEGPQMLPHFAITAFAGVRKEEAPDIDEDAFLLDDHHLIELNRTKGGRKRRNAEIAPALLRILTWCRAHGLALNYYSDRKFDRIRRHAGLYDVWSKDVLRHTYASHHYAVHRDIDRLVASMGNSEDVLFQSYVRAIPRAEGVRYMAVELDFAAPRRTSLEGRRIDRLLARPPAALADEDLRLLRTLLRAATARRGPRPRWQRDDNALAAQLVDVETEAARRFKKEKTFTPQEAPNFR